MDKRQKGLLKKLIQENIVTLRSGKLAAWGSKQHIKSLEDTLLSLTSIRNSQPRRSASRENYNNAIRSLRSELKSARRHNDKLNPPKIDPDMINDAP